jgi:hypothetical protein
MPFGRKADRGTRGGGAADWEIGNSRREKRLRMITDRAEMPGFLLFSILAAVRGRALFIFPSC